MFTVRLRVRTPPTFSSLPYPPMAPSVLLIDSDADSITIYSLILQHHGYEVLAARDSESGFRMAIDRRPDLVISEMFLPPLGGRSLLEKLRENDVTNRTPMILLDSIGAYGNEISEFGVSAMRLTKPCEPSRLVFEVERMLNLELAVPRQ